MNVGSLFSGIDGLGLGLERAGMTVRWQSEIDPYCCKVLKKQWPHVPNLGDVTKIDWEQVERVDLVCGGYPCQPFSLAGARRGEADPRHLWPYFAECLRVLRPRYALLENVPGHLGLGFGRVLGDLADLGFDAEWECIPAAAVGAPHLRYRVFVVAHSDGRGLEVGAQLDGEPLEGTADRHPRGRHADRLRDEMADAPCSGLEGAGLRGRPAVNRAAVADADSASRSESRGSGEAVFGPGALERLGRCRRVLGDTWTVEPDVGRVAHGVPSRVDRLRALGNAVVPQVAEWIGERIMEVA